jgi:hypothetical protein
MQSRICLFLALFFASALSAGEQTLLLESPGPRVSLLELYTSEGCSSCPPADRWVSQLRDDPRLWREVVPVAFHVDYWDYIGWKDRFASPVYGNRQRDYARNRHVGTVYTPGFVLAGKEWRSWFYRPVLKVEKGVQAGNLKLSVNGQQAKATFTPSGLLSGELEMHVAVLGFGLTSEVQSGENDGRTLEHDFVVLGYRSLPTEQNNSIHTASFSLPQLRVDSDRKAIAAWLSAPGDPSPIQAVGGWLNNPTVQ